ncbi:beta-glucoside bgl operon antiterminator, BglG family [Lachnospiraceae bacterium KM106-2]|nr:beta-glucoside bgl operon antiterminator, BglG family [Lachnospiraceae bacterium KM106-2]
MYVIKKVINNNIVCSTDELGNEIILRGLGIGFNKKAKDTVPKEAVEKIYRSDSEKVTNKLEKLIQDIPYEHLKVSTDIVDYAANVLGRKLNEKIYLTLTDHISFAIERKKMGLEYQNPLLWEIRNFYPKEFQISSHALEMIEESLGIRLVQDEAGFIALHIVNAQLETDMGSMIGITELIQAILEIIEGYYEVKLDKSTFHFERFVTHLKYFAQKVFSPVEDEDDDSELLEIVKKRYKNDFKCAEQIKQYVEEKYKKSVSDEELIFLTIHLRKLITQ